jgi:acetylserotonin N-methyltransferase
MPQDLPLPDPAPVRELLEAFRRSKTMFAAVSLGVFDTLAGGPMPLAALAEILKANADAVERLLDACVNLGLLSRDKGGYANTPAAATYLCKSSPRRLTGYINFSNGPMWKLWTHLEDAVREGTHRWTQVYGWDGPIFSHFFQDEEAKREFLMGMHGYGLISSPHIVAAFDLSPFKTIVDLGGATGHLVVAACERTRTRGRRVRLPAACRWRASWSDNRQSPSASKSSPATSSPIRCRRGIYTPWGGFCTTGPSPRSSHC